MTTASSSSSSGSGSDVRTKTVRIGGASGFYGDSQLAPAQLVQDGDIDYLVFDYLAEITMSIFAYQRMRDPAKGYAEDFVTRAMRSVLADVAAKKIKVVANAGGVNPDACAAALTALCEEMGVALSVASVSGDDILPDIDALRAGGGGADMRTGAPLPAFVLSANAYLGARPIADALAAGADIVVTGRVVDSAVVLGPLMHEFGWADDDLDALAAGSLAGHVLECGCQATGGLFTDWEAVGRYDNLGYPIAEVSADGSFVVSKPPGTDGLVSRATIGEQILYEIGDPANYRLADVTCDFTGVTLEEVGPNQVRVIGARGKPASTDYKVSATYPDGNRLIFGFMIGGIDARAKGRAVAQSIIDRCARVFRTRNMGPFRDTSIECIGAEDTYGPHAEAADVREVYVKIVVTHDDAEALKFVASEAFYVGTSGVPGLTGVTAGRPKVQPMIKLHSTFVAKADVPVRVVVDAREILAKPYPGVTGPIDAAARTEPDGEAPVTSSAETVPGRLIDLAFARSGDKGDICNIGVMARRADAVGFLRETLTADRVKAYFAHSVAGAVERFELPGLGAFNFVMHDALGGGGTSSLRMDPQGKAAAQMLLSMRLDIPAALLDGLEKTPPAAPSAS